jgi:trehalose 6-phosphate phosphatase
MFSRLDPKTIALLLDVDGTVLDLAPTPQSVHVPSSLRATLERLSGILGGALAFVSGRPIADLDSLFSPLRLPAVGGHGAEMRLGEEQIRAKLLPEALRRQLAAAGTIDPGIVIEDKNYSVALHYRNAPGRLEELRRHIARACSEFPGEQIEILPGKAMVEVKRIGVSKGAGVRALMQRGPFEGRQPVFIGDDVTDESVFALMPELHGIGFSVQRPFEHIRGVFPAPEQVRQVLDAFSQR